MQITNELSFIDEDLAQSASDPDSFEISTFNTSHLPQEILRSNTVESLITQNEDLMARLKVSIRKMAHLESENQRLKEAQESLDLKCNSLSDQILIFKEKDQLAKRKVNDSEFKKTETEEKLKLTEMDYALLRRDYDNTYRQLRRLARYHQKIKTFVRPQIRLQKISHQKLSEFCLQLEDKLSTRDALIKSLREQIGEITNNVKIQIQAFQQQQSELVENFEAEKNSLSEEIRQLTSEKENFKQQAVKLEEVLLEQDSLRNDLIAQERSKAELRSRYESETDEIKSKLAIIRSENQKLSSENQVLKSGTNDLNQELSRFRNENENLLTQLESLRQLWHEKSSEMNQLKANIAALEKLNLDLSQSLKTQRQKTQAINQEINDVKKHWKTTMASENTTPEVTQRLRENHIEKIERLASLINEIQSISMTHQS